MEFVSLDAAVTCPHASPATVAEAVSATLRPLGYRRGLIAGDSCCYTRSHRPGWAVLLAAFLAVPTLGLSLFLLRLSRQDHVSIVVTGSPHGTVAEIYGRVPAVLQEVVAAAVDPELSGELALPTAVAAAVAGTGLAGTGLTGAGLTGVGPAPVRQPGGYPAAGDTGAEWPAFAPMPAERVDLPAAEPVAAAGVAWRPPAAGPLAGGFTEAEVSIDLREPSADDPWGARPGSSPRDPGPVAGADGAQDDGRPGGGFWDRQGLLPPDVAGGPVPRQGALSIELDTGEQVRVAEFHLLGRDPRRSDGDPPAGLIRVDDETLSVSKTHIALGVDAVGCWVIDRESTNGSAVLEPEGRRVPCLPWTRQYVPVGSEVQIGQRRFRVVLSPEARAEGGG